MATLNWIGKQAVVNHDKDVPFKLLKKIKSASVGKNSQNLVLHGDNLEALKALMPYYTGKVDCIYIDPQYNTLLETMIPKTLVVCFGIRYINVGLKSVI